jgi:hypothetical protein
MPISSSVCCNISFVTRNGVGDGDGEGSGVAVGDGVWANALIGRCGATIIAVPRAGTSLTNERRSKVLDPFAVRSFDSDLVPGFLDMGFSVSLTRPSFMVGQGSTHSLGPRASRPHAASPDMLSGRGVRARRAQCGRDARGPSINLKHACPRTDADCSLRHPLPARRHGASIFHL